MILSSSAAYVTIGGARKRRTRSEWKGDCEGGRGRGGEKEILEPEKKRLHGLQRV